MKTGVSSKKKRGPAANRRSKISISLKLMIDIFKMISFRKHALKQYIHFSYGPHKAQEFHKKHFAFKMSESFFLQLVNFL